MFRKNREERNNGRWLLKWKINFVLACTKAMRLRLLGQWTAVYLNRELWMGIAPGGVVEWVFFATAP